MEFKGLYVAIDIHSSDAVVACISYKEVVNDFVVFAIGPDAVWFVELGFVSGTIFHVWSSGGVTRDGLNSKLSHLDVLAQVNYLNFVVIGVSNVELLGDV